MKTTTDIFARRLALTLLAVLTTTVAWAQLSGAGTEAYPYIISSRSDWDYFETKVNAKDEDYVAAYYELVNDLTLGEEGNPITTVVGNAKAKPFKGTFDGGNHTIHINMRRTNDFAAPFGVTNGATIKNLTVDGTITTNHKFAAGFVGYANNDKNLTTTLINCISRVHISCDSILQHINVNGQETTSGTRPYDCTHGGLVGQNEAGRLAFINCAFEGSITDSKENKTANKCTGFVAWVNIGVSYSNCIMAGTIDVKPNDDNLKNSMATFHRLAQNIKATFDENAPSYYINDYTHPSLKKDGTQALEAIPDNKLVKIYTVDKKDYYIPGVTVDGYDVSFCSEKLVENQDYLINIETLSPTERKLTISGNNNFGGIYTEDIESSIDVNVPTWESTSKTGWRAISSPINGQAFSGVTNLKSVSKHNIYRYDESKRQWQEYRNDANRYNVFENGRGYVYRSEDVIGVVSFNGKCNTGKLKLTLSRADKVDDLTGFNLIGNPYAHEIYKGVEISNEFLADDYYILLPNGNWEVTSDSEAIPVGSAILVQATKDNAKLVFDEDATATKRASSDNIWFTVANSEYSDVACVNFREGHSLNKMAHYNEDAMMLYIINDGENFASANMSESDGIIELGFEAKKLGQYTLTFKANGSFGYMHLIDKMTGADIDLLADNEYSFIGTDGDDNDRFIVKLSENAGNTTSVNDCFAWQSGNDVIVEGNGQLQIFDVTGRMVMTQNVNGIETINVNANGVYIFRLIGNETKTQKIVVR